MKYLGKELTYKNPVNEVSVTLIPDKEYNVTFEYEGPQIIINGQPVYDPNGVVWAYVEGVGIPYAPHVLSDFWRE